MQAKFRTLSHSACLLLLTILLYFISCFQTKWVTLGNGRSLLVLTSLKGIQVRICVTLINTEYKQVICDIDAIIIDVFSLSLLVT